MQNGQATKKMGVAHGVVLVEVVVQVTIVIVAFADLVIVMSLCL